MHRSSRIFSARFPVGAFAVLALASCTSAGLGTQGRLVAVHNAFEGIGLGQMGHVSEGSLAEGATARFPMDLSAQCHAFVAFGTDGVRDLELQVLDASGRVVATESHRDAQSSVRYCPTAAGRYDVVLRMASGAGGFALSSWREPAADGAAMLATGRRGQGFSGPDNGSREGACAGVRPIAIGQTVTGSTRDARDSTGGSCIGRDSAGDVAYELNIDRRLQVTVAGEMSFDGALYLRRDCEDADSEIACNDDESEEDTHRSRLSVALDPGRYFVFVDGLRNESGNYTLSVTGVDVPTPAEACANATPLVPGQAITGTTRGDADVFHASCANHSPGPDHVYRLEVPQESRVRITQETSGHDGVLSLRRACADDASEVACNDDAGDVQHSRINTVLPAGTYYVLTDGFTASSAGNFTLQADIAPAAGTGVQGDSCADAPALALDRANEGDTISARDDVSASCTASSDGYDMVYRLDVASRGRLRLWFESADIGEHATIVVSRACGPQLAASAVLACRAGAMGENDPLSVTLERGRYYVAVDSNEARAFGQYRLQARMEDIAALEQACRTAPLLTPGRSVSGSTSSASDRFNATCAGGAHSPDSLYRLVIRRRSRVTVSLETPRFDGALYIRRDCADQASEVACNDDDDDTHHSRVEATLDPGTYYVVVDGFSSGNSGDFTVTATVTNP